MCAAILKRRVPGEPAGEERIKRHSRLLSQHEVGDQLTRERREEDPVAVVPSGHIQVRDVGEAPNGWKPIWKSRPQPCPGPIEWGGHQTWSHGPGRLAQAPHTPPGGGRIEAGPPHRGPPPQPPTD